MADLIFKDRKDAARRLALKLSNYESAANAEIFALPRGGVETGFYIAKELGLPLHALAVKKISAPGNPELAVGAVAENGEPIWDKGLIRSLNIPQAYLEKEIKRVHREVQRRVAEYGWASIGLKGKTAVVVDDGIATGLTMLAAVSFLKELKPAEVVAAAPVLSLTALEELKNLADNVVYLEAPADFYAVGQFYTNFPQLTDERVKYFLKEAARS